MELGEIVQSNYADVFKHRYGGAAPWWRRLSEQERELWAMVEGETLRDLFESPGVLGTRLLALGE